MEHRTWNREQGTWTVNMEPVGPSRVEYITLTHSHGILAYTDASLSMARAIC